MTSARLLPRGVADAIRTGIALFLSALLLARGAETIPGEELFVAVGYGGRTAFSHDGANWSDERQSGHEPALSDVAYGLGRFVAVGGSAEIGQVVSTRDGRDWVELQTVKGPVGTIAFGKGRFVAAHGNALLWSSDGERFRAGEQLPIEGSVHPRRSACGDTEAGFSFLIIGDVKRPGDEQPVHWRGISLNGERWTFHVVGTAPVHDVAYGSGHFVVVGPRGLIESSHDGQQWKRHRTGVEDDFSSVVWTGKRFLVSGGKQVWTSPDGLNWKAEMPEIPCAIAWAREGRRTLGIGLSVAGELWTSDDLLGWRKVPMPPGPGFRAVAVRDRQD